MVAKDGSKIELISDIGNINHSEDNNDNVETTISNARIVAILQLDSYRSCLRCKAQQPHLPWQIFEAWLCNVTVICCLFRTYFSQILIKANTDMHTLYMYIYVCGDTVSQMAHLSLKMPSWRFQKFSTITFNELLLTFLSALNPAIHIPTSLWMLPKT